MHQSQRLEAEEPKRPLTGFTEAGELTGPTRAFRFLRIENRGNSNICECGMRCNTAGASLVLASFSAEVRCSRSSLRFAAVLAKPC